MKIINKNIIESLFYHFGTFPNEVGLKKRTRIHQGCWRMNVLNEKPGHHPIDITKNVCNTILNGQKTKKTS